MIFDPLHPGEREIESLLAGLDVGSVRLEPGSWLIDGSTVASTARDGSGWLVLERSLPPAPASRSPWSLVRANGALEWPAKLALGAGAHPAVRAEVAMADDMKARAARVRAAWGSVESSCARFARGGCAHEPVTDAGGHVLDEATRDRLAATCVEVGWPLAAGDGVEVEFGPGGGGKRAAFERLGENRLRVRVGLGHCDASDAVCRDAIGVLLLSVARIVRGVRPFACEAEDGAASMWLAAELEPDPAADALDRALSALAVASASCAQEVGALLGAPLAAAYLVAQGVLAPERADAAGLQPELSHLST